MGTFAIARVSDEQRRPERIGDAGAHETRQTGLVSRSSTDGNGGLSVIALIVFGVALSAFMISRCQVGGDQLDMLSRGWLLAFRGEWLQVGTTISAGGKAPGGLTALLVGLPLFLWHDHRAAVIPVLLLHVAAYLLLDRLAARSLGPRARVLFGIFYWLNPWRLYSSGYLWDPNYLVFFGALHTVTAFAQRERASFWASLVHVVAIGLAAELHASAALLAIVSLVLVWRGLVRPHGPGLVTGGILVGLTLLPWLRALEKNPEILPGHGGFSAHGVPLVLPLLRGFDYLLRYASFALPNRAIAFDFTTTLGAKVDAIVAMPLSYFVDAVGLVTCVPALIALIRLMRAERWRERPRLAATPREWLGAYTASTLAGAGIAFAVSPTTIMFWQSFIILHVTVLPLVLWMELLLRGPWRKEVRLFVAGWAAFAVVLGLAMALGAPFYRRGGREAVTAALGMNHPILSDLNLTATTGVGVDPLVIWWPDVLPKNRD